MELCTDCLSVMHVVVLISSHRKCRSVSYGGIDLLLLSVMSKIILVLLLFLRLSLSFCGFFLDDLFIRFEILHKYF